MSIWTPELRERMLIEAERLGIDVSSWREGGEYEGTTEHFTGLMRLTQQRKYEQQWPYLHSVADLEERHVLDCPMTNKDEAARDTCICRSYDPAMRTEPEGI